MDQLEQLERLARLRESGVLSEDEFQQQKARVLAAESAARRNHWPWFLAVAGLAGASLYFMTYDRAADPTSNSQIDSKPGQLTSVSGSNQSVQAPPPQAPPPIPAIGSRLNIAGGCQFAPELEQAFTRMLHFDQARQRFSPRAVDIAGMRIAPTLTTEPDVGGEPGDRAHISTVRIPGPVTWNGLQLRALQASDAFEASSWTLEFQDSPARVRAVLQSRGIRVPAPPGQRMIPTDGCQASIAVEARRGGAALACHSWC